MYPGTIYNSTLLQGYENYILINKTCKQAFSKVRSALENQIQVLVLSHQSVGSNPGCDTCVLEQDASL